MKESENKRGHINPKNVRKKTKWKSFARGRAV